ncbi:MAG TPA: cupin domain-containing protein [Burkholderiales bacterium]|nr:cupin domain-containing protein [Burkholderiales bacterium]
MGCFELRVPPGSNVPPPHSHSENEELLYVLEGALRTTVGGKTEDLQPGESRVMPRCAVHGFSNPHSVTAPSFGDTHLGYNWYAVLPRWGRHR